LDLSKTKISKQEIFFFLLLGPAPPQPSIGIFWQGKFQWTVDSGIVKKVVTSSVLLVFTFFIGIFFNQNLFYF
jgi:hypothetical protein